MHLTVSRYVMTEKKLFIVGVVGIPNTYGGFEALAENLAKDLSNHGIKTTVFCAKDFAGAPMDLDCVRVERLKFAANGPQSVLYDLVGMIKAASRGGDVLLLGTAGTVFLPLIKFIWPNSRFSVNIGGLEWAREKWGPIARFYLRLSEWTAVKYADNLIADNQGLCDYLLKKYGAESVLIPYGGDQYDGLPLEEETLSALDLRPGTYDFALARAQPDNNLELVLRAYAESGRRLVFVSNWSSSEFGRDMKEKFSATPNLHLIGPIYKQSEIQTLRRCARFYVHGHSAGGTNPTLVEAMHAGLPILAFDVVFNRYTTDGCAQYFRSASDLNMQLARLEASDTAAMGSALRRVALNRYTWAKVSQNYRELLRTGAMTPSGLEPN